MRDFLVPYIHEYDAFVFTMMQFVLPALDENRVRIIAPAIDPFATKNMELSVDLCKRAIADCGVDPNRPLLLQVSRFDPWKDPMGVIEAYRLASELSDRIAAIAPVAGPMGTEKCSPKRPVPTPTSSSCAARRTRESGRYR